MTKEENAKAALAQKRAEKIGSRLSDALEREIDEMRRDVPPGIEVVEAGDVPPNAFSWNIGLKLLFIQQKMRVAKNRGKGHTPNAQVTYEYRNAEDILEAAKPLCAKVGAVLTLDVTPTMVGETVPLDVREVRPAGKDYNGNPTAPTFARAFGPRFVALAKATLKNCNGDDEISCRAFAEIDFWRKGQTEPEKLCGSADSYASKYALGHLFALDNNRDADMESDTPQSAAKPKTSDPF